MERLGFGDTQLDSQMRWRAETGALSALSGRRRERFLQDWREGIWAGARQEIDAYVRRHNLKMHTMAAHLLSSQVFCFNFLGPFMARPEALSDLLTPILGERVLPTWLPGEHGFVAFEWISDTDYLNEGGATRRRGSHCTSVDAAVGFARDGRRELLLIEWKYSESYGSPIPDRPGVDGQPSANEVRMARYGELFGQRIVKQGHRLQDFFWEPFYQLLRQQMLAAAVERDQSYPAAAFSRATLAHVSPSANEALKRVTAKPLQVRPEFARKDACQGWRDILAEPDRYVPVSIEALFRAFPFDKHPDLAGWRDYMAARYAFLAPPDSG